VKTRRSERDRRVDRSLRLVMGSPDGEEFGGCGEYLEITPLARFMRRIVAASGSARK
jgi:hypothetical protein